MAMDLNMVCQECGQPMLETRINLTDDPIPICHNLKCNSIVNEMTDICRGCRGALRETRINLVDPPLLTCTNLECPLILGPHSTWPAWLSATALNKEEKNVSASQVPSDVETQNLILNPVEEHGAEETNFLEKELGIKIFRPPKPWSPLPLVDESEFDKEWTIQTFRQDLPALLSPIMSSQSSESELDSDSDQSQVSRVSNGQQHKYAKYFVKASEETEEISPFKKPLPRNRAEKSVVKTGQRSLFQPKAVAKNGFRNESKKDDISVSKDLRVQSNAKIQTIKGSDDPRAKRRKEADEERRQNIRRMSFEKDDATLLQVKAGANSDQHKVRFSTSNGLERLKKQRQSELNLEEEVNGSTKISTNNKRSLNTEALSSNKLKKTSSVAQKMHITGQHVETKKPLISEPIKFVAAAETDLIMPSLSEVYNGISVGNEPKEMDLPKTVPAKKTAEKKVDTIKRKKAETAPTMQESSPSKVGSFIQAKRSVDSNSRKSNTFEKTVLSSNFKSESVPKSSNESGEIVGKGRFVVSFRLDQHQGVGRVRVSSQEEAKAVHTLLREKVGNGKDSKAKITANAKARNLLPEEVLAYIENACSKKGSSNGSNNAKSVGDGSKHLSKSVEKGSPKVLEVPSRSKEASFESNGITLPSESELDRQWSQRLEREWPRQQSLTANLLNRTNGSDKKNMHQNEVDMELLLPNNIKVSLKAAPTLPQASSNIHTSSQCEFSSKSTFSAVDAEFLQSPPNLDCSELVTCSTQSPDKKSAVKDVRRVTRNPCSVDASIASKMLDALKIKRKKETVATTSNNSVPSPLMILERTFVRGGKQETRIKRDLERRAAKKSKLNFRGWQKEQEQGQQRKQSVDQNAKLKRQQDGQQEKQTVKGVETRNGEKKLGGALAKLFSQADSIGGVKKMLNTKSQSVKIVPPVTTTPTSTTTTTNDVATPSTSKKHVAHVSEEERDLLDDLFNLASDVIDNDIVDSSLGTANQSYNNPLNFNQNLIDGPSGINMNDNLDYDQSFLLDL